MATYLIAREITITRQEGDAADVVVTVPSTLSMTGKTARFQVRDSGMEFAMTDVIPMWLIITVGAKQLHGYFMFMFF